VDTADGSDKLVGTNGNDAIFLHNLVTKGDLNWLQDKTSSQDEIYQGKRLLGLNEIDLKGGDNFLDLSGDGNSLSGDNINITVGAGADILWLSDANETVNTGAGHDELIVNGGNDTIATGVGNDIITIADNVGTLTLTDFNPTEDTLVFSVAENKITRVDKVLTVENPLGNYQITIDTLNTSDVLADFSTFV